MLNSQKNILKLICTQNLRIDTNIYTTHPEHTKRSIIFSHGLRVSRICSYEIDFKKNTVDIKLWFLKRGSPKILVDKELEKIYFFSRVGNRKQKMNESVPFIVIYHLI